MIKSFLKSALVTSTLLSSAVVPASQIPAPNSPALPGAPWLQYVGSVSATGLWAQGSTDEFSPSLGISVDATLVAQITKKIQAVVSASLWRGIMESGTGYYTQNGDDLKNDKIVLEKLITESYLSIDVSEITGQPWAVINIGKSYSWSFCQNKSSSPVKSMNLFEKLCTEGEVLGITVALAPSFGKQIGLESIAASIFETGRGDFSIDNKVGGSIKITQKFGEKFKVTYSGLGKQNGTTDKTEYRVAVGFIYKSGRVSIYGEGMYFENQNDYPNANYAAMAGLAMKYKYATPYIEAQYIANTAYELLTGLNIPVGKFFTLTPEVRKRIDANKDDQKDYNDWLFIANLKFYARSPNPQGAIIDP